MTTIKELEKECEELDKMIGKMGLKEGDFEKGTLNATQRHLAHLIKMREKVDLRVSVHQEVLTEAELPEGNRALISGRVLELKELKAELFGEEG